MSDTSGFRVDEDAPRHYEDNVTPFMIPFSEALVRAMVKTGDAVLDVACGTGIAARIAVGATGSHELLAALNSHMPTIVADHPVPPFSPFPPTPPTHTPKHHQTKTGTKRAHHKPHTPIPTNTKTRTLTQGR
jgi:hypothetical protein